MRQANKLTEFSYDAEHCVLTTEKYIIRFEYPLIFSQDWQTVSVYDYVNDKDYLGNFKIKLRECILTCFNEKGFKGLFRFELKDK